MMNRVLSKKIIFLGIILGIWIIHSSHAEVGRGGYAGSFLRLGLGARAMGMGNVSVAHADDGCCGYYNPANLVFLENRWLTTSMRSMSLDRKIYFIGYGQPLGERDPLMQKEGALRGGFSLAWLCGGVGNIDARDYNGEDIGTLSNWEHAFFFSFAINPAPAFALGFNGKVLLNRIPDITDENKAISATGFGFDFGLIFRPNPLFTVGLTFKDIRSRYTWDTQDLWEKGTQTVDQFPRVFRLGLAWKIFNERLILAGDIEQVKYRPRTFQGGVQWMGFKSLFLRTGFQQERLNFGAGLRIHSLGQTVQIDYGYIPDPVTPHDSHVLTCSWIL